MKLTERLSVCIRLGAWLESETEEMKTAIHQASILNPWFDQNSIRKSIQAICKNYLDEKKLSTWLSNYNLPEVPVKFIGLIMAGNIPLVGFHDLLCVFLSGHSSKIKLAHKDQTLMPVIIKALLDLDKRTADYFEIVDRIKDIDAVLATGSDNSARYFQYYFGKYPHIIRKNRVGVAVLNGNESEDELLALGEDVFSYYGLGCRNVSSLWVPLGYDFSRMLKLWEKFNYVKDNNSYHNNYDYNIAIHIMGNKPYMANEAIQLVEQDSLSSRIAALNYQYYRNLHEVKDFLKVEEDKIQVVVTTFELNGIVVTPPGSAQSPALHDYADGVDTLKFLTGL